MDTDDFSFFLVKNYVAKYFLIKSWEGTFMKSSLELNFFILISS